MGDEPAFGGRHADRVRENLGWCRTVDGTPASIGELLNIYRGRKGQEPCIDSPVEDVLLKALRRLTKP